ncbi:bifunctional diguanylate cyclase/phosphodiesterase [Grimontia marina]|uniref:Cyclic di-GMP phosphodiesterase Gmr n=1 Tax=Grimontia marina TaxID=646534 RepID=A0A128F5X1_9GAMM|nr:EAL domain-containing protein [Grimontia marina]CZF82172.1 Cyclic di-GMP phosphodiesterase Gmr [Grimontia marina]
MFSRNLHWIVFVVGTVAALCSGFAVYQIDEKRQQSAFNTLIEQRLKGLEKALHSFHELQLSAQLYFQTDKTLSKRKFQQFLASRTREESGIHSVFWLPKVFKDYIKDFENRVVRNEGGTYNGYQTYPQPDYQCSWALSDYAFPVLYVSPQNQVENYIGWRAESQCQFAHAMERAFFQRKPEASFFDEEGTHGIRLFSAVILNDELRGYLVTSIYFDSFFSAIWPNYSTLNDLQISLRPEFSSNEDKDALLFQSLPNKEIDSENTFTTEHLIRIPGSEEGVWLTFTSGENHLFSYRYSLVMTVLGFLLTIATSFCIWSYSSRLTLANQLVKEQTKKLRFQAYHDNLTSLSNRLALEKRLEKEQSRLRNVESFGFSILFIDLDRFKNVNDSLGHLVGDKLLQSVADRLFLATQTPNRVFRFGGDEFVVCLADVITQEGAYRSANVYLDAINQPYLIDGHDIQIGASVGISTIRDHGFTLLDIIQQADIAMYHAKESGASVTFFHSDMLEKAQQRFNIEQDLGYALELNQLSLVYQPICKGENVLHFESLLRWQHPEIGAISPMTFIPIAEDTNQIHIIGRWVLAQVCQLLGYWQAQSNDFNYPGITVNVSAKQLVSPAFISFVETLIKQNNITPYKLGLEITESTLMEDEQASAQALQSLRKAGVRLYLDDFGTGYSSLSLLGEYVFDVIKIDRHFITNVTDSDKSSTKLCAAMIQLARTLEMDVVAEGVETEEQLEWLTHQGDVSIQGYLKSRPLPVEDLIHWHPACKMPKRLEGRHETPKVTAPFLLKPNLAQA